MYRYNEANQGEFKELEYGKYFTFRKLTPDSFFWNYAQELGLDDQGFLYEIDVADVGAVNTRLAKILKTVAYVITDEDAFGTPVIEKWNIKRTDYLTNY